MSTSMEEQLEAELRKLERKMIHIHGEQFEPDSRPRCDVSRSSTFADVAVTERKRRDGERREVKNKQNMYRDQLIKTYRPLLEEELRKIDGNLPQVGTPAHKKLLTKIRTQIFVRVRSPTLPPPPSLCRVRACVRACVRARARDRRSQQRHFSCVARSGSTWRCSAGRLRAGPAGRSCRRSRSRRSRIWWTQRPCTRRRRSSSRATLPQAPSSGSSFEHQRAAGSGVLSYSTRIQRFCRLPDFRPHSLRPVPGSR